MPDAPDQSQVSNSIDTPVTQNGSIDEAPDIAPVDITTLTVEERLQQIEALLNIN